MVSSKTGVKHKAGGPELARQRLESGNVDEGINFGLLTALGSFPAFPADKDKDLPHGQSYNTRLIKSEIWLDGWK